jgi:hypothetical protein
VVSRRVPRAAALALLLVGCGGSSLPEPARGAHLEGEPIAVPFPPPPARPDVIGSPPHEAKDPVWVDGQWVWRGRSWVWQPGQWWERPPDQVWAAPAIVRLEDGQLVWFEGTWRAEVGLPVRAGSRQPAPR